jgi:flagellar biosynthetic protein FlhB
MPDLGEKTEAPTARRRTEAREEGNVAKSQDLTAGVSLMGAILLLGVFGQRIFSGMKAMVEHMVGGRWSTDVTQTGDLGAMCAVMIKDGTTLIAPLALGIFALCALAIIAQIGFLLTVKPITPSLNKLSPIKGFKQIFSLKAMMRLVMSMAKVAIVIAIVAVSIYLDLDRIAALAALETAPALAAGASLVYWIALRIALVLLLLGVIDFFYQRWQTERELRMSKQEVKEEFKRMEGDPLVKQRRTKVARQLIMQRLGQAVPQADVVVTNPTHFAVALSYDGDSMNAPKVVAKGADYLALRIRQLAALHSVPIVERKELARSLYRTVEVGQEIPPQFYSAVAEILAYVYRLNNRRSA